MGKLCRHPADDIQLFLAALSCAGKLLSLPVPGFLNLCSGGWNNCAGGRLRVPGGNVRAHSQGLGCSFAIFIQSDRLPHPKSS